MAQDVTLLLLHGGEILKGERAHGGSPERVSLHDGFQSGSEKRKPTKEVVNRAKKRTDFLKILQWFVWQVVCT